MMKKLIEGKEQKGLIKFNKVSTENIPFFNRDRIFTIYKRPNLTNGTYLYWVEEDGKKIKDRFALNKQSINQLFALNNHFLR